MKKPILFLSTLLSVLLTMSFASCEQPGPDNPNNPDNPTPEQKEYKKANQLVVYECNERLFATSDAFKAIDAYLPTLQEMQVNVLWLMPIHPRGEKNTVWSPYCVKDFKAIDPTFGTMADLKQLVDHAHSLGMKVILDWIANHTAQDNAWYTSHPEYYTAPSGDEVAWKDVVPLDYSKKEVQDLMQDALLYWVREADVDGYRCDYAHGVPTSFWQQAISAIRAIKPEAIMLAETADTKYYKAGFDWLYSWDYLGGVQSLYQGKKSLAGLYGISAAEYASTPSGKERLRYVTTHDATAEHAPSTYYANPKGELSAFCLTAFYAGVPMIYSSQEIGDMNQIAICEKTPKTRSFSKDNETTKAYTTLLKAYNHTVEARYGEVKDYSAGKVAMFTRTQEDKSILVVVNTSNAQQEILLPAQWQRDHFYDELKGDSVWTPKSTTLAPYEYQIYSK